MPRYYNNFAFWALLSIVMIAWLTYWFEGFHRNVVRDNRYSWVKKTAINTPLPIGKSITFYVEGWANIPRRSDSCIVGTLVSSPKGNKVRAVSDRDIFQIHVEQTTLIKLQTKPGSTSCPTNSFKWE